MMSTFKWISNNTCGGYIVGVDFIIVSMSFVFFVYKYFTRAVHLSHCSCPSVCLPSCLPSLCLSTLCMSVSTLCMSLPLASFLSPSPSLSLSLPSSLPLSRSLSPPFFLSGLWLGIGACRYHAPESILYVTEVKYMCRWTDPSGWIFDMGWPCIEFHNGTRWLQLLLDHTAV